MIEERLAHSPISQYRFTYEIGHEISDRPKIAPRGRTVCTCSDKGWQMRCLKASVLEAIPGLPTRIIRTAEGREREGELGVQ